MYIYIYIYIYVYNYIHVYIYIYIYILYDIYIYNYSYTHRFRSNISFIPPQLRSCQEAAPEDLPRLRPGRRRAWPAAPAGRRGDGVGSAEPLEASPGAQRRRPSW